MAESVLEAVAREGTGKGAARRARQSGMVPGVIYGGGEDPTPIAMKHNELLKALKKGKFLSTLHKVQVGDKTETVVCKGVQRDVVRDLPSHVDFQRLTARSRIKLAIPVEFVDHGESPGLKRGGALTITRHEVELWVTASTIPDHVTLSLKGTQINDTLKISNVDLPKDVKPVIHDRDFAIATITAPSGLAAAGDEEEEEGEAEEA